ncbi:hypothetical protein EVAR_24209_1 [Eumeta japonica]|uniref:Uncharacterized protein n=1 Tax=Eumeta variegata TaxID=151549 RepID=A0A4C1W3D4_EUMVA|nr:hypothetical protein EVAR_24209_1 [Eumeta japonica]
MQLDPCPKKHQEPPLLFFNIFQLALTLVKGFTIQIFQPEIRSSEGVPTQKNNTNLTSILGTGAGAAATAAARAASRALSEPVGPLSADNGRNIGTISRIDFRALPPPAQRALVLGAHNLSAVNLRFNYGTGRLMPGALDASISEIVNTRRRRPPRAAPRPFAIKRHAADDRRRARAAVKPNNTCPSESLIAVTCTAVYTLSVRANGTKKVVIVEPSGDRVAQVLAHDVATRRHAYSRSDPPA